MKRILILTIVLIQSSLLSAQTFTDITPTNFPNLILGSVDFGDYDNDNDLDILISGIDDESGTYITTIFKNDNGTFNELSDLNISAVCLGNVEWGDFDRDGDLDILAVGLFANDPEKVSISRIYENIGNDKFLVLSDLQLPGIYHGIAKWGDYNNDGLLDIVMAGHEVTAIYQNNGNGQFTELKGLSLPYIFQTGQVDWGDYDNDGDLDLFFAGYDGGSIGKLFRNDGNNSFVEDTSSVIKGTHRGSVKWGDYDSDGDIDLAIAGDSRSTYDTKIAEIYENKSANLTINENAELTGIEDGAIIWGDFNNDGLLDLFVVGYSYGTTSCLYTNNGNQSFLKHEHSDLNISGFDCHDIACGDIDNDHDLDLIIIGENIAATKIYRNDITYQNTIPLPPANLKSEVMSDTVLLSWDRGSDQETPQTGLSYNISIQNLKESVVAPMSNDATGKRKISAIGNCSHNNFWKSTNLKAGIYKWKVQTIDNTYEGSEFSASDTFRISASSEFQLEKTEYCADELVKIIYTGNAPSDATFEWDFDGATVVNDTLPTEFYIMWHESGEKKISLQVNYGGKTSSSEADHIIVSPKPDGRLYGDTIIREGETGNLFIDLTGTPPFSINYSNGSFSSTITTNNFQDTIEIYSGNTYQIINISDATGCSSGEIEDAVNVKLIPNNDTTDYAMEIEKGTLKREWQYGALGDDLGDAGLLTADLDQNGVDEIIVSGLTFFTVLEYDFEQNIFVPKWISDDVGTEIHSMQLNDFNKDGSFELFLGLNDGRIYIYSTTDFLLTNIIKISEKETYPWDSSVRINCIEFADIDNGDSEKLLACTNDTTFVYNTDFELMYKIPFGSAYFKIGDIDNDQSNEIVYSNGNIIQFRNNEFQTDNKFFTTNTTTPIQLSDMNGDNTPDIIYSSKDTLYVYNSRLDKMIWSTVWNSDYNYNRYITGLWLYDYDGDNISDVFIGDRGWDAVYCYNGKTGKKDLNIRNNAGDGVTNVVVSDFDNDSNMDVAWTTGADCTCADYLFVYDLKTKTKKWQSKYFHKNFKAFDIGDVNSDEKSEIVLGSFGEYLKYYDHGFLSVFDTDAKNIEYQNSEEFFSGHTEDFSSIKIGDINNDGINEILLGVESGYSWTYIYAFDEDFSIIKTYQIDGMSIVLDMEIADIDLDNKNELIVTSGTNVSGSSHPQEWQNYIYIFDSETGELEHKTAQLAGIDSKIGSLNIGNIDADNQLEIVALKYNTWRDNGELIIIDGFSKELTKDNRYDYTSVTLADLNKDNRMEIIAAANTGKIVVLNGMLLDVITKFKINCGVINAIECYDLNSDQNMDIVLTDQNQIFLYDITRNEIFGKSETINSNIGLYNSMKTGNFDSDENIEIFINGNHGLFNFEYLADSTAASTNESGYSELPKLQVFCYPNPFRDQLTISVNLNKRTKCTIKLVDLNGKKQFEDSKIIEPEMTNITINTTQLPKGIYLLIVQDQNQILGYSKLIKMKK
uniref:T9SS type A sorting domain-containing protein n=1 Tax=uncultured Draconibacterium sp. TaxID=1573823 RepID=UPI00321651A8